MTSSVTFRVKRIVSLIENNKLTPSSRSQNSKDTDSSEIRVFLAITPRNHPEASTKMVLVPKSFDLQGVSGSNNVRKKVCFFVDEVLAFHEYRNNGYETIIRNLDTRKIYELYEALNRKFKSSYIPECEASVNESLLLHKGRLAFKLYIPNKRSKYGVKFY
ncbi:hypothetical protein AVEN_86922-1 [Araneus ventricosus]|uniref:PiggyBac transposable element-derived protein domain-containing protein n=1 Tax=Araneus ventricosus TaxID=182803 RepID=A0A4Y2QUH4_ARAVE|nr:hypothetical protein AVEN_86922-1 [Araneus ventricosus]